VVVVVVDPASAVDVAVTVEATALRFRLEAGKSPFSDHKVQTKTYTRIGTAVATVDVGAGIVHTEYTLPLRIHFTCALVCNHHKQLSEMGPDKVDWQYN